MTKDKAQKQLAIKFLAAQNISPFVEVVVRSQAGLEEVPVDITDIDVLGLDLGRLGAMQRILFDCKSGSKLSAINRCIWVAGLREFVKADRGYVIQKKDVPYSHKVAASSLNVSVHSEETFAKYASSISGEFVKDITYLDALDIWETFTSLGQSQPALGELISFVTTQAALETSGPRGIRIGLSTLIKAAPELDPKKSAHCFLFQTFVSSFLIFLGLSMTALKELFWFSMQKEDFERTVRYFVWEGRENYVIRRNMKAAIDKSKGEISPPVFELPEWDRFLHIARLFLDAPEAFAPLPFLMKEISFRGAVAKRQDPDEKLRRLFAANNRARQFIFACAAYLVAAAKLPKEFSNVLEADINSLVEPGTARLITAADAVPTPSVALPETN